MTFARAFAAMLIILVVLTLLLIIYVNVPVPLPGKPSPTSTYTPVPTPTDYPTVAPASQTPEPTYTATIAPPPPTITSEPSITFTAIPPTATGAIYAHVDTGYSNGFLHFRPCPSTKCIPQWIGGVGALQEGTKVIFVKCPNTEYSWVEIIFGNIKGFVFGEYLDLSLCGEKL